MKTKKFPNTRMDRAQALFNKGMSSEFSEEFKLLIEEWIQTEKTDVWMLVSECHDRGD